MNLRCGFRCLRRVHRHCAKLSLKRYWLIDPAFWLLQVDLVKVHLQLHLVACRPTKWLWTYNNERPHTAIGGVLPRQLIEAA